MDYKKLLENDYLEVKEELGLKDKYEFLGNQIFDFLTDDGECDSIFAKEMCEVLKVLLNKTTFDYFKKAEGNYKKYLTMINTPFLINKINYGGSVRGAWLITESCNINGYVIDNLGEYVKDLLEWVKI